MRSARPVVAIQMQAMQAIEAALEIGVTPGEKRRVEFPLEIVVDRGCVHRFFHGRSSRPPRKLESTRLDAGPRALYSHSVMQPWSYEQTAV